MADTRRNEPKGLWRYLDGNDLAGVMAPKDRRSAAPQGNYCEDLPLVIVTPVVSADD